MLTFFHFYNYCIFWICLYSFYWFIFSFSTSSLTKWNWEMLLWQLAEICFLYIFFILICLLNFYYNKRIAIQENRNKYVIYLILVNIYFISSNTFYFCIALVLVKPCMGGEILKSAVFASWLDTLLDIITKNHWHVLSISVNVYQNKFHNYCYYNCFVACEIFYFD